MAKAVEKIFDFKSTRTYAALDSAGRRELARVAREDHIGDEQLFYLLYKNDLLHMIRKDERKKANQSSEFFVVMAAIAALVAMASRQPIAVFVATAFLCLAATLYFGGFTNSYSQALRQVKRKLKSMPAAEGFNTWLNEHPIRLTEESNDKK